MRIASPAMLPYDIVEQILAFLSGDRKSILSCSTVCRSFAALSHVHLFSSIAFKTPPRILPSKTNFIPRTQQFYELLQTSPHLGGFVQSLDIINGVPAHLPPFIPGWIARDDTLPFILSSLPNLRRFSCRGDKTFTDWSDLPSPLQHALAEAMRRPALTHLELSKFIKIPFHPESFSPVLTHLSLSSVGFQDLCRLSSDANPNQGATGYKIQLQSLTVRMTSTGFRHLVEWLQHPSCPLGISALLSLSTMRRLGPDDASIHNLVKHCASSLEELVLSPPTQWNSQPHRLITPPTSTIRSPLLKLATLPKLRILGLRFVVDKMQQSLPGAIALLRSFPSSALEEININCHEGSAMTDDVVYQWIQLDALITKFARVKTVTVTVTVHLEDQSICAFTHQFAGLLPQLHEAGVLAIRMGLELKSDCQYHCS